MRIKKFNYKKIYDKKLHMLKKLKIAIKSKYYKKRFIKHLNQNKNNFFLGWFNELELKN